MKSQLLFSNKEVLKNYIQLIRLILLDQQELVISTKITVRMLLISKRLLLNTYKKLLKIKTISRFLNANLISTYCLLKRYFFTISPWIICNYLNLRSLAFFTYHFLVLYRAIFVMKMVMDWFPIKNWDRASPFKRFLRRVTIGWTRQFENYLPSILAWIIVINIVPMLLSLIEVFYLTSDLKHFPTSYKFDEILEFVIESNLQTNK